MKQEIINFIEEQMGEKIEMVIKITSDKLGNKKTMCDRLLIYGRNARENILKEMETLYRTIGIDIWNNESFNCSLFGEPRYYNFTKFCEIFKTELLQMILGYKIDKTFYLPNSNDRLDLEITFALPE